jgi:hypothetical protein
MLLELEQFLSDVECTAEMFERVNPVLGELDRQGIKKLMKAAAVLKASSRGTRSKQLRNLAVLAESAGVIKRHAMRLARASTSFREQAFVGLVSRFDYLCSRLVKCMVDAYPGRLNSSEKGLTYTELAAVSSLDEARAVLVEHFVRASTDQGRSELVSWLGGTLGVPLKERLPLWSAFLEMCERRNAIIHRGSIADRQYLRQCKAMRIPVPDGVKEGKPLGVNDLYFANSKRVAFFTGLHLADQTYRALFPKELGPADNLLVEVGLTFVRNGDAATAEAIFEYAMGLPTEAVSSDIVARMFRVNYALALREGGKIEKSDAVLRAADWSASDKPFHLAIAALRGDNKTATSLAVQLLKAGALKSGEIDDWPILRRLRRSKVFRDGYRKAFRRDYAPATLKSWTQRVARPL